MNGSRYRFCLVMGLALALSLGASSCSKKSDTASTTGSSAPTTAAKGSGTTVKGGGDAKKPGGMCGVWPAAAAGEPQAMKQPDSTGYFVWQDVTGWHVRVRGGATIKEAFKGQIRGSRDMTSVKETAGSGAKVELKGNVVTFDIPASGDLKGFDLVAGCAVDQLQFTMAVGNNAAPVDSIFVGGQGKAVSNPFIQQKLT